MRPATIHRFHHVTAGVRLELTWNPPALSGKARLRSAVRRALFGGPNPFGPEAHVPQAAFDRAMDLLNAGPDYLEEAEAAFRNIGYSVRRSTLLGEHVHA